MLKGEKEKKVIVEQKKIKKIEYSELRYMYFTTKSIHVS